MPFRHLTGHRHLLELLARAVARESLPPSLIFAGPPGVGKHATGIALAQALNCERPVAWPDAGGRDGCGECGPCRRVARGVHADLVLVAPGDNGSIRVDQVRDAIDKSAYRPFEGRRRVVIVDDADALVAEAQNALLKTLEEPPPASVFVLVTPRSDLLLPTVRSRCQRLRFGPLSPADVADVLMRSHGFTAADAHAAAAAADGSIGQVLAGGTEDAVAVRDAAVRLVQSVAAGTDPRRRIDAARQLTGSRGDREQVGRRLRAVLSVLRDLGAMHASGDDRLLANGDLKPQLQSWVRAFDPDRLASAFAAVDRGLSALDRNASPKIVADWVALNM